VLYVTLEPCSTTGRTGPCTDAIINAGIKHVVIGVTDPNPKHAGKGIGMLRNEGIEVRTGVLASECAALNEAYNRWIRTRRPFVIAKCGMSLDGRLTAPRTESPWITSASSRRDARALRGQVDAILVGAGTLRSDNPRLTVRRRGAKQPWRIILSRSAKLPKGAEVFTDRFARRTMVCGATNLELVLAELGKKEITSVLVEGGGEVLGELLDRRLIDKVRIYVGPRLIGGPVVAFSGKGAGLTADGVRLERIRYEMIGQDICIEGYPAAGAAKIE
jgi:diaminohydroxyphosphoribosylaminopyrimidine deaminase/5-amino-6-(5-phosphoribosylamino)uracil reductase